MRNLWPLVPIVLLFALFLALVDPVTRGLAAVWVGEIDPTTLRTEAQSEAA